MYKLIATFTNHHSPLETSLFEGEKTVEFFVNGSHDHEEILQKLEPVVSKLRGESTATLGLTVKTEIGSTVLRGTITSGFSGVSIH